MKRLHISAAEATGGQLGEIYYTHNKKLDRSSAFELNEACGIKFVIPRAVGTIDLKIELFDQTQSVKLKEKKAALSHTVKDKDIYVVKLGKGFLDKGLYFYKVVIKTLVGDIFAVGEGSYRITFSQTDCSFFQLSFSDFSASHSSTLRGGVIYHIFVDRFSKDEDVVPKKGARLVEDWTSIPEYPEYPGAFMHNNTFYGGTLRSAEKRLDYVKSLGVNIIYLSPIFESPSNHKYDTADYMRTDSMFGSDEALRAFLKSAKKRGISVILDGVFNHTGADSIYFNRYGNYDSLGAYQSKDWEYYAWYTFKSYPDDYESWWGIEILPRINTGNRDFEAFITEKVIPKYRAMGISGLRLDVADELSDEFIAKIKQALSPDETTVLYGEVWEDASNKIAYGKRKKYYLGEELDGVMNYPLRKGLIEYFRYKKCDELKYALTDIINNAPKRIRDMQMNILGTHDTERIITALGGTPAESKTNKELASLKMTKEEREVATERLISAYTVLATLPGIPAVFYGDEAGLEGYSDPFNRMPYPSHPDQKILNHYKKIGQIRKSNNVYNSGEYKLITLTEELLVFSRSDGNNNYITFTNNRDRDITIDFSLNTQELLGDRNSREHTVPGNSTLIFKTRDDEFSLTL